MAEAASPGKSESLVGLATMAEASPIKSESLVLLATTVEASPRKSESLVGLVTTVEASPRKSESLVGLATTAEASPRKRESLVGLATAAEASPRKSESLVGLATTAEGLDMDNAMNATLFAEELVEYVLRKLEYEWECESVVRKIPSSFIWKRFTPEIGEAVFEIFALQIHVIAKAYRALKYMKITSKEDYGRRACLLIPTFFQDGYNHRSFLILAAQFIGLAVFYFENDNSTIADVTAQVLAYTLNFYTTQCKLNVKKSLFDICLTAQHIRREIKSTKNIKMDNLFLEIV